MKLYLCLGLTLKYLHIADSAGPKSVGRILASIGNTVFLGLLGASAYFGYYTYRYTTPEIQALVEETEKPENGFPGSNVMHCPFESESGHVSTYSYTAVFSYLSARPCQHRTELMNFAPNLDM